LPNPTLMLLLWSLLLWTSASSGHADTPAQSMSGNDLVAKAADALVSHQSIKCKLYVHSHLFGQQMVAVGSYRQQGSSQPKAFRLELATQAGGSRASLLQVCDGDFVWVRRKVGTTVATRQIDLRRVRQAIAQAPASSSLSDPMQAWLVIGGLPRLFTGLQQSFDFGPAKASQLGDRDVWTVKGTWKSNDSAESSKNGSEASDDQEPLASRISETVSLILAKSDLFPYRIEFNGRAKPSSNRSQNTDLPRHTPPIVIITEDIQIGGDPLDVHRRERDFTFRPGIANITDYTDEFIKQLGL